MNIEISTKASPKFKDLAWEVFFKSRHRGVSLEMHFPFFKLETAHYVTVTVRGEVVAGLVIIPITPPKGNSVAGLVGLVCVHPEHRGAGHSTAMLHASIRHARERQFDDLILWTSKPAVYQKLGFEINDTTVYGSVTTTAARARIATGAVRSEWPCAKSLRGLPPFAMQAYQWTTVSASITVLEDANGAILAEWSGTDEEVLGVINQCMPNKWRINALQHDSLLKSLVRDSWELDVKPSNLQMILNLRERYEAGDLYRLRILDRI